MFDSQFAILFQAVERLGNQLEGADEGLRSYLAEELRSLRTLNNQWIDYWMSLEEQIQVLAERYNIELTDEVHASTDVHPSKLESEEFQFRTATKDGVDSPTENFAEWMNLAFADHDVSETPLRKGIGYFDLLMYDQAADFLIESLSQAEHPVARLFLGATYLARKENHRAQRELLRVREITRDPLLICTASELEAHILASRGQVDEAIQLLTAVARTMPEYPDVWYNLGLCFALSGHHEKSIQSLEHSLRLEPRNEDTSRLLALVLLKTGDVYRANKTVLQALQQFPYSSELLLLKSELAFKEQRFDDGAEACRQVLRRNPKHLDARSLLAKGLLQEGQVAKAIGILKKQLAIQPNQASVLVQLGIAYLLSGRYERAEQCILTSMVSYADKGFLWLVLGRISAVRGDTEQAYYRYLRCIRNARKPVKRLALYLYGLTLYEDGQYAESEKYLKAAHLLGEPNTAITVLLAKSAEAQGHIEEAELLMESVFRPYAQ